ncbi:MAG: MBL fold metallo-hydrolase [Ignavibacteria bacterium]|nr:MBL fold metallo-hydrolase [Ignavibacteria bacterium]
MKVKFWGTRGSVAVTGKNHCKYGGNTPCIEISNDEEIIILDAGTGIRELGIELLKKKNHKKISLYFSHFHTDHIVGLPFFLPFYNNEFEIDIFGKPYVYNSIEEIIDLILKPPLFAITKDEFKAKINFHNIDVDYIHEENGLKVQAINLNHPNPTIGYKIELQGKSVVYFTDNELIQNNHTSHNLKDLITENHPELIKFCTNADILIHDSSYFMDDYNKRIGWGHSSNYATAMFAHLANVKNLYLFHYEPTYSDDKIDELLSDTIEYLNQLNSSVNCFASADFLEVELE